MERPSVSNVGVVVIACHLFNVFYFKHGHATPAYFGARESVHDDNDDGNVNA